MSCIKYCKYTMGLMIVISWSLAKLLLIISFVSNNIGRLSLAMCGCQSWLIIPRVPSSRLLYDFPLTHVRQFYCSPLTYRIPYRSLYLPHLRLHMLRTHHITITQKYYLIWLPQFSFISILSILVHSHH